MKVTNRKILTLDWEDYLRYEAYSFSRLRNPDGREIIETPKMRLGTLVHNYLLEPAKYNGENYKVVKPTAIAVKSILGNLKFKSEVAISADFEEEGLVMPYKGRLDIDAGIVIDLKVSQDAPAKSIAHWRYDWQVSGYAFGRGYDRAILISVNPIKLEAIPVEIKIVDDWWRHQVKTYGKPL
jgi:hypothetical protein